MIIIKGKTAAGKKSYYITIKAYNKVISRELKFWVTEVGFFCLFWLFLLRLTYSEKRSYSWTRKRDFQ